MLLTISTTYRPADDLGYLFYKHPARIQSFDLAFGKAHVFYPEVNKTRCTIALLLDVDPTRLVRRGDDNSFALQQYVNDRPYVVSSFMSVAISDVFGTAMTGKSKERPELAEMDIPFEVTLATLRCRGGKAILHKLFEPLGYHVQAQQHALDPAFPQWGESNYFTAQLAKTVRLKDLLSHLYVLIPVLDDDKHYYVGKDEVEKLLRHGEEWLSTHPERVMITQRYLRYQRGLTRAALSQLIEPEAPTQDDAAKDAEEAAVEEKLSLHQQRLIAVLDVLKQSGAKRVVDLGCGEGRLLTLLFKEKQFAEIVGMDVTFRSLEFAAERLNLEHLPERQRERIRLIHGSLLYQDDRLKGYDAAAVVEVIEHLDPPRLAAFERVVFGHAKPTRIVITTPNAEYNSKWETLPAGQFRHKDHRFEWTRQQFQDWADNIANTFGYQVNHFPIGSEDEQLGAPSQMGVFDRV